MRIFPNLRTLSVRHVLHDPFTHIDDRFTNNVLDTKHSVADRLLDLLSGIDNDSFGTWKNDILYLHHEMSKGILTQNSTF